MPTLGTFGAAAARGFGLTTAGRLVANIVISSDTTNYTLNTAKITGYKAGATDVTLTINSGVTVYSTSTGSYAFTVDNSWTTGDTLTVVNNGVILGRGGDGGQGVDGNLPFTSTPNGNTGGPALLVQRVVSINNVNRIAGGGGGGGGGSDGSQLFSKAYWGGSGGGGGIGNGGGGRAGTGGGAAAGNPGGAGTLTSAGSGGVKNLNGGAGGNGGTYGSSGSGGQNAQYRQANAGSGGAAGAAVVGNSNITWIATGTRNGSIS